MVYRTIGYRAIVYCECHFVPHHLVPGCTGPCWYFSSRYGAIPYRVPCCLVYCTERIYPREGYQPQAAVARDERREMASYHTAPPSCTLLAIMYCAVLTCCRLLLRRLEPYHIVPHHDIPSTILVPPCCTALILNCTDQLVPQQLVPQHLVLCAVLYHTILYRAILLPYHIVTVPYCSVPSCTTPSLRFRTRSLPPPPHGCFPFCLTPVMAAGFFWGLFFCFCLKTTAGLLACWLACLLVRRPLWGIFVLFMLENAWLFAYFLARAASFWWHRLFHFVFEIGCLACLRAC